MPKVNWVVIIVREGVSELTPFTEFSDAQAYCDQWSAQWTESYLCEVKKGPLV